jgi:hypothetical protein
VLRSSRELGNDRMVTSMGPLKVEVQVEPLTHVWVMVGTGYGLKDHPWHQLKNAVFFSLSGP